MIIDTRDLIEKRDELKQSILDDFNDKFNTEFDDFDDVILDRLDSEDFEHIDKDAIEDFKIYWETKYKEIEEINQVEEEVGSEFSYGCTLIEEDDFEDYCEELVIDCGYIPKDFPSWIEIDWEATASNMKQDYSELDYQGITYLFRA